MNRKLLEALERQHDDACRNCHWDEAERIAALIREQHGLSPITQEQRANMPAHGGIQ